MLDKKRHTITAVLFTLYSPAAADQEGEDEEEEDEEDEDDEEDEEDEEDEAEEKNLKKMEEQRSQGKVRGRPKVFCGCRFLLCRLSYQLRRFSVPAGQSDARQDESRGPGAPGAGGKGGGETSCNYDDEEEGEVPI